MNKKDKKLSSNPMYLNAERLAEALDCSRLTATRIGIAAGAKVKFGRCARYNVEKIKEYLEGLTEEQGA